MSGGTMLSWLVCCDASCHHLCFNEEHELPDRENTSVHTNLHMSHVCKHTHTLTQICIDPNGVQGKVWFALPITQKKCTSFSVQSPLHAPPSASINTGPCILTVNTFEDRKQVWVHVSSESVWSHSGGVHEPAPARASSNLLICINYPPSGNAATACLFSPDKSSKHLSFSLPCLPNIIKFLHLVHTRVRAHIHAASKLNILVSVLRSSLRCLPCGLRVALVHKCALKHAPLSHKLLLPV